MRRQACPMTVKRTPAGYGAEPLGEATNERSAPFAERREANQPFTARTLYLSAGSQGAQGATGVPSAAAER